MRANQLAQPGSTGKQARHRRGLRGAAGFSLLEMLVALFITTVVMGGVIEMFQMNTRIARKQTMLADMQQNMRISLYDILRYARMAGRGGLPAFVPPDLTSNPQFKGSLLPTGVALSVQNNVPDGTTVAGNPVMPGTDILTLRGVLFGPVFQVQSNNEDFTNRRLQIDMLALGVAQDLEEIAGATLDPSSRETLLLISSRGATLYGLAEVAGGGSVQTTADADGDLRTVGVTVPFTTNGARLTNYRKLMRSGVFPTEMSAVAYLGVLEEYRYYVRASPSDASDPNSRIVPRLSRARFFPGSDTVHPTNPTGREDIADNIWDLQIALGVDRDNDGEAEEGLKAADRQTDEWLFNSSGDELDDAGTPGSWQWNGTANPLHSLRISILVRSERPDVQFTSEAIDRIEDHTYGETDYPTNETERLERRYHRRLMQTTVAFRNF